MRLIDSHLRDKSWWIINNDRYLSKPNEGLKVDDPWRLGRRPDVLFNN